MRAICHHPVPFRYRPARVARDRMAFLAVSTPVEIPEADSPPERIPGDEEGGFLHDGVVFDRMTWGDLLGTPGKDPVTSVNLCKMLGLKRHAHAPSFPAGSPLAALSDSAEEASGSELPRSVMARHDGEDHTQAARAALARHISRTFLVHGDEAFMRRRPVVVRPHLTGDAIGPAPRNLMEERCGAGLYFEPERFGPMLTYLKAMGYRGYVQKAPVLPELHRSKTAGMPNNLDGGDLARWVNDAPSIVETIHRRATDRLSDFCEVNRADTAIARLRRFSILGLVGAVPPEDHPSVVEALHDALTILREAIPAHHPQPPLNWFLHYSEHVARPAVLGSTPWTDLDPDDATVIAALAPRS